MTTSLIITTFNEEAVLADLLESILLQTVMPAEVIIVDGGSTDGTVAICRSFVGAFIENSSRLEIIESPGANIAYGRNLGINKAKSPIVAVTDAGCKLKRNWLEIITEPIKNNFADFVGGGYEPIAPTKFQRILAKLTVYNQIPENFLPSSRSIAFTKQLWVKAGGYPEYLNWGEDTCFNKQCLQKGARYIVAPEAVVFWEVRKNLRQVIKQFYRYALGDGLALRFSKSMFVVQLIYWTCISLTLTGHFIIALAIFGLFHITFLVRKIGLFSENFLYGFMLQVVIQSSRFCGYISGLIKRLFCRNSFKHAN